MKPPPISVIIPVWNGGERFARCLAALARSEEASYELIVVDDGSTDSSPELARVHGARLIHAVPAELQTELPTLSSRFPTPNSKTANPKFKTPAPDAGHGPRSRADHGPRSKAEWGRGAGVQNPKSLGPAAARNAGARQAEGEILFFLDADIEVRPDTLSRVAAAFACDPGLSAVFGSYDDDPAEQDFLSQYKNLLHHFVHQSAREQAFTFWAGCGAVRREAFTVVGGFDAGRYRRPSIEDIDLGYRLTRNSGRVKLLKGLQVKHLKRWTPINLVKVDMFDRAIPWARLLWREARLPRPAGAPTLLDLNLRRASRVSLVLTYLMALAAAGAVFAPERYRALPLLAFLAAFAAVVWLNRSLYFFFHRKRGPGFLLMALPWHLFYFLYSGLGFALGTLMSFWPGTEVRDRSGDSYGRLHRDDSRLSR